MAKKILILGDSGAGKSTAIRNLDPASTYIIQGTPKELPFKGSSKNYNKEKRNLRAPQTIKNINGILKGINEKGPHIKTIVIDDFNYFMNFDYFERIFEKGYDKYNEIAKDVRDVFNTIDSLRDDLIVYVMAHIQRNEEGIISTKTVGKLLDNLLVIEGLFTIVFLAFGAKFDYKFKTGGIVPAKAPVGMFENNEVENDLALINKIIKEYYED